MEAQENKQGYVLFEKLLKFIWFKLHFCCLYVYSNKVGYFCDNRELHLAFEISRSSSFISRLILYL